MLMSLKTFMKDFAWRSVIEQLENEFQTTLLPFSYSIGLKLRASMPR